MEFVTLLTNRHIIQITHRKLHTPINYPHQHIYLLANSRHQNGTKSRKSPFLTIKSPSVPWKINDIKKPRNRCNQRVTRFYSGGEREIRTLGTYYSSHDFQVEKTWISGAFCHAGVRGVMAETA